jgi:hypothetical protein
VRPWPPRCRGYQWKRSVFFAAGTPSCHPPGSVCVPVLGLRRPVALLEPCQQTRRHRLRLPPALPLRLPPTLLDGVVEHRVGRLHGRSACWVRGEARGVRDRRDVRARARSEAALGADRRAKRARTGRLSLLLLHKCRFTITIVCDELCTPYLRVVEGARSVCGAANPFGSPSTRKARSSTRRPSSASAPERCVDYAPRAGSGVQAPPGTTAPRCSGGGLSALA